MTVLEIDVGCARHWSFTVPADELSLVGAAAYAHAVDNNGTLIFDLAPTVDETNNRVDIQITDEQAAGLEVGSWDFDVLVEVGGETVKLSKGQFVVNKTFTKKPLCQISAS